MLLFVAIQLIIQMYI